MNLFLAIAFFLFCGYWPGPIKPAHINDPGEWVVLFDGKDLKGWDTYLGPLVNPANQQFAGTPLGLNNDPNKVFTVVKENEGPAIRISGENFGGI